MIRLAWRMLTQHPTRAAATFVALLYGAAVLAACGVLLESGIRYHGPPQAYAGAAVVVAVTDLTYTEGSGPDLSVSTTPLPEGGRVDLALAPRIAALRGVRRVIADVTVPVQVAADAPAGATASVTASGHPWSAAALTRFTLTAGRPPAAAGEVVLGAALAGALRAGPGGVVRLVVPGGAAAYTVTGIARSPALASDPVVFFTDEQAALLYGHPGTANVLGVIADPGVRPGSLAAAVRAVLPGHPADAQGAFPAVYSGAGRGMATSPAVGNGRVLVIALASTFGGCAFVIAILVISGTVGLSVQQRHRDIALLRAVAATPGQVRRMLLAETSALAVLAGAAGIWAGLASAGWLRSQLVSQGFVPASFTLWYSWLPPVASMGGVLIVTLVAAWIAGLRASRIRPAEALRESVIERGGGLSAVVRATLGLVVLAGAIALVGVASHLSASAAAGTAIGMVAAFVLAVALLAPWLTRIAVAVCTAVLRGLGVPGRLAAANLAASARRLSPVVSALVLAVALCGSLWFLQTSIRHAATVQGRAGLRADQVLVTTGPGLPPDVAQAARRVPGVAAVTGVVTSTMLDSQGDDYTAEGVSAAALPRVLDLGVVSGSLAELRGESVAVDTVTAADLHLRAGQQFRGWFGDGAAATLRVVAIYQRGLGFANLTLPADVLLPHTAGALEGLALVADAPGASRATVATALSARIRSADPAASVAAPATYQAALSAQIDQNNWTIHVSVAILLVYVVIAALNTLAMAALARRREFAVLRLAGATRGQLLRMARLEQTVLLGLALVTGGLIAGLTLVPMVRGTTGGAPYIPLAGWVAVIGGAILLSMAGTLLPLLSVLRLAPTQAVGLDE